MVSCLRKESVEVDGLTTVSITLSLFPSVGGCFMIAGGWEAEVREERIWHGCSGHQLVKLYLSEEEAKQVLGGWSRKMNRMRITHLIALNLSNFL